MKQDHAAINANRANNPGIDKRIVYHLAGQAAAIYLGNKQKQLPAVHFNILIEKLEKYDPQTGKVGLSYDENSTKIAGGRLIQSLPLAFAEATCYFSQSQKEQYQCAIEADVTNLLAGALAEAKYVALRDNEVFSANLVNLDSLQFYSGNSDLEAISEYMECYLSHEAERDRKLKELFFAAFSFVNLRPHWRAITNLAEFIQNANKSIVTCEEVISLLGPHSLEAIELDSWDISGKYASPTLSENRVA